MLSNNNDPDDDEEHGQHVECVTRCGWVALPSTLPLSHTKPDWGYAADHRPSPPPAPPPPPSPQCCSVLPGSLFVYSHSVGRHATPHATSKHQQHITAHCAAPHCTGWGTELIVQNRVPVHQTVNVAVDVHTCRSVGWQQTMMSKRSCRTSGLSVFRPVFASASVWNKTRLRRRAIISLV